MLDLFTKLNELKDSVFWVTAILGSGLCAIQMLLAFLGGDAEDGDTDFDTNFKWLSKQALTGFLMMFGWAGLTCRKEFAMSGMASAAIGVLAGIVAIIVTGIIFKMARKLRSPGTVFRLADAIGKEAQVYQRIPKGGMGRIMISLQNITHEVDAVSEQEIESFALVQVVEKIDEKTVLVIPRR